MRGERAGPGERVSQVNCIKIVLLKLIQIKLFYVKNLNVNFSEIRLKLQSHSTESYATCPVKIKASDIKLSLVGAAHVSQSRDGRSVVVTCTTLWPHRPGWWCHRNRNKHVNWQKDLFESKELFWFWEPQLHRCGGGVSSWRPLAVLLQQLQDGGKHLFRSIKTPNEIQMFPVFDVLMVDQVRHLRREREDVDFWLLPVHIHSLNLWHPTCDISFTGDFILFPVRRRFSAQTRSDHQILLLVQVRGGGGSRVQQTETGSDVLPLLQRSRDHVHMNWHLQLWSPPTLFTSSSVSSSCVSTSSPETFVSRVRSYPPPPTQWLSGGSSAVFTLYTGAQEEKTNWVSLWHVYACLKAVRDSPEWGGEQHLWGPPVYPVPLKTEQWEPSCPGRCTEGEWTEGDTRDRDGPVRKMSSSPDKTDLVLRGSPGCSVSCFLQHQSQTLSVSLHERAETTVWGGWFVFSVCCYLLFVFFNMV